MEFIATIEGEDARELEYEACIPTLLLNSGKVDALEGYGSDLPDRYLSQQFYPKSVVVQDTRVSRRSVVAF